MAPHYCPKYCHKPIKLNCGVVTVAGICNSVGGGVLFNIPPRCRCWWWWRVQYAPCIAGQSSVSFPSPHALSQCTCQPPPPLLIIRCSTTRRIVAAVSRATDRRSRGDDGLVQQCISRLIALVVLNTKYLSTTLL